MSNPNLSSTTPEQEPFAHEEWIQFADGRLAMGYKTPGDRIDWDERKYTKFLDTKDAPGLAIVSTESGRRFAIGSGVAVMLPESLGSDGKFKSDTKELAAKSIVDNLPDLTIGEPWEPIGNDEKISDVVIDYKTGAPGQANAHQIPYDNPFDHAIEIVRDVAERMDTAGQLYPRQND